MVVFGIYRLKCTRILRQYGIFSFQIARLLPSNLAISNLVVPFFNILLMHPMTTVDPSTTACSALQRPPAMPSDNCYLCPGPHPSPLLTCQNLCSSTERKTHRLWSLSKAIQIYAFLVGVFPLMRSSDEEVASSDQTKKNWKKLAGTHVPTIRVPRRLATWWLQNRCPSAGLRST